MTPPICLFLNALTAAPPALQPTVDGLLQERRIGRHKLPDTCFVVAAGNGPEDGAIAYEMGTALSDRLIHLSFRATAQDWVAAEALAVGSGGPTPAFRPGTKRRVDAPRIALAIDASGSITGPLLQRFMGEVCGIARRVAAEITLIAFDDGVRWQVKLDPVRWQTQLAWLDWPRGGGTDFAPPLAAAQALGASIAVVLTDLDGPHRPAPHGMPVIWAVNDDVQQTPFGKVLSLAR